MEDTPTGKEISPIVGGVEQWHPIKDGLALTTEGVFLGKIIHPNGKIEYKDHSETLVSQAGFAFGVEQSSAGFTGIYVKAIKDHVVEGLAIDPDTKAVSWMLPEFQDRVRLSSDWGKLLDGGTAHDWVQPHGYADEGIHAGIFRVTDKNGIVRYFIASADFAGDADDWNVTGTLQEIDVQEPESISSADLGAHALNAAHREIED